MVVMKVVDMTVAGLWWRYGSDGSGVSSDGGSDGDKCREGSKGLEGGGRGSMEGGGCEGTKRAAEAAQFPVAVTDSNGYQSA